MRDDPARASSIPPTWPPSCRASAWNRSLAELPLPGEPLEAAADPAHRAPVRERDEHGVVTRDGADDLGPARTVERGGQGMCRARQRAQHEHGPGVTDVDGHVVQQRPDPVLAARVGLPQPRGHRVRLRPGPPRLHEAELGDVPRDRRLRRPEAAFAERTGQLLLGPDGPLLHQVADRPLAELLHDLHQCGRPYVRTTNEATTPTINVSGSAPTTSPRTSLRPS